MGSLAHSLVLSMCVVLRGVGVRHYMWSLHGLGGKGLCVVLHRVGGWGDKFLCVRNIYPPPVLVVGQPLNPSTDKH